MAHGDLLEEGSRLFGRETHRKEHLLAGLYGLAVVCDLRAVARRVGLYHHDGLVRAVLRSDAHLTAPAERKLAQIDRPVVEQQYLSVQLFRGMIVRYVFDSLYLILA